MPPTRRRAGNTASTRSTQPALSFGSKSRVTKPSTSSPVQSQKAKILEPLSRDAPEGSTSEISELEQPSFSATKPPQPHVAELAVRQQAKTENQQPFSEQDKKAIDITQKELLRYWNSIESKRRGPRVHQEELTLDEKILRHFDLSSQFGPCIGIARLKRWRRANNLKLNPPLEVLAVLLGQENTQGQRAYVDELMS